MLLCVSESLTSSTCENFSKDCDVSSCPFVDSSLVHKSHIM